MLNYVENVYHMLQRRGFGPRFQHAGIYKITIDGILVYIGKSTNMLYRLAEHYVAFKISEAHKYRILAEAKQRGHKINFDVMYYAKSKGKAEIEEEIGRTEGEYIRKYRPPLNTQIPKESNWREYDYNPRAVLYNGAVNLDQGF